MTSALIGISLKMYMGAYQTKNWVASLREHISALVEPGGTEVFVLPSFPLLESTSTLLHESKIRWGAQDLAASPDGAQTGEVDGAVLRQLGCTYVEVGHAERRGLFAETNQMIAQKMQQSFANNLVPVLCVGETARSTAYSASKFCLQQLKSALGDCSDHDLVVAYEPVWAIGATEPADPEHVREVCSALRNYVSARSGRTQILYGGSAGPGTFDALNGSVDGLFLGRFAHDISNVIAVLNEIDHFSQNAASE